MTWRSELIKCAYLNGSVARLEGDSALLALGVERARVEPALRGGAGGGRGRRAAVPAEVHRGRLLLEDAPLRDGYHPGTACCPLSGDIGGRSRRLGHRRGLHIVPRVTGTRGGTVADFGGGLRGDKFLQDVSQNMQSVDC